MFEVAKWFFYDVLGSPLLYHIYAFTSAIYFITLFGLRSFPVARMQIAQSICKGEGLYIRYFTLLSYALDRFRLLFFNEATGERRALIQIYATFLAIALGYTAVLFFIGWITGGSGSLGKVSIIIPDYSIPVRVIVSLGFAALGIFVWMTVNFERFQKLDRYITRRLSLRLLLAVAIGMLTFSVVWSTTDRQLTLSPWLVFSLQATIGIVAFIAMSLSNRPLIGVSYGCTALYGYGLGIPILIAVPLTVAIATPLAGTVPILLSTTIVPLATMLYYYALPVSFQQAELANIVLAAIAFFPVFLAIFFTGFRKRGHISTPFLYSFVVFLVLWFPASLSSMQISDPVAFAIVVFWFVIPTLNAIWDSTSWAITWLLLNSLRGSLLRVHEPDTGRFLLLHRFASWMQKFLILSLHIFANIMSSIGFFVVTFFVVIVALKIVNVAIRSVHPEYMLDVKHLVNAVSTNPYVGEGLWIITVIFATLFPALVHLFVVFLTVFMMALAPHVVQRAWNQIQAQTLDFATGNRAIQIVSIYIAASFFFGSLVLLTLWSAYWKYAAGYSMGRALNSVGQSALSLSALLGI